MAHIVETTVCPIWYLSSRNSIFHSRIGHPLFTYYMRHEKNIGNSHVNRQSNARNSFKCHNPLMLWQTFCGTRWFSAVLNTTQWILQSSASGRQSLSITMRIREEWLRLVWQVVVESVPNGEGTYFICSEYRYGVNIWWKSIYICDVYFM